MLPKSRHPLLPAAAPSWCEPHCGQDSTPAEGQGPCWEPPNPGMGTLLHGVGGLGLD